MKNLLLNLSSSDILLAIIVIIVLIIIVVGWIIITNHRKKELIIPKKKVETLEEILQEPVKPPVEDKSAIQNLLDQMAQDLETKEKDDVVTFEQEQEEKAIISYQQLLAAKKGENNVNPITPSSSNIEIIDIPEEPINALVNNEPIIENKMEKDNSSLEDTKRFRSTEFISPVFGRSDMNVQYRNVDRSAIMAKLTPKEVKHEVTSKPLPPKPVEIPKQPVSQAKEPVSIPNTRIGRLEAVKPQMDEIVDLKELETTIRTASKNEDARKDEEFLKSLIAFRKNLE